MRYTIRYLADDIIVYESDLNVESAREAAVSAQIGLRWARSTFGADSYQVMNESGRVVASGPPPSPDAASLLSRTTP